MKILCFGSLNLDYVYSVDHIVNVGETENTTSVSLNCGGKGLNQAVALAKAGAQVWLAGLVGKDGKSLVDKCIENKIYIDYIRMSEERSGHTIIQVDRNGNNSILLFGGANRCMTKEYIDEVLRGFSSGDILLLQNEINMLNEIIEKAYEKEMHIVLNPSPFDEALQECDLNKVSMFLLNEIEGEQMTGEKETDQILRVLGEKYKDAQIVLTLGEEGAVYKYGDTLLRQNAYTVKAVDTTAAGDTFTGYYLYSVVKGMKPEEGLKLASKASAMTVTRHGAMDSIPTMDEVLRFNARSKS